MTLDELHLMVRRQMVDAGLEQAGREARLLIGRIGNIPAERFLAYPEAVVSEDICSAVLSGLQLRLAGMPIGRIVGEQEFYGRHFKLGPEVLEPRADSEVLIDAALEILGLEGLLSAPIRIIDVGTGSGCLLITLLAELPAATGLGVDISEQALVVARENAARNGVGRRAEFSLSDALANVEGTFDLLISNPPYICTADIPNLGIEVRSHDPQRALDGGVDGLDIYRRIGHGIRRVVPHGWIVFEVGAGMVADVRREIDMVTTDDPSQDWGVWRDFNGIERCVTLKIRQD